METLLNYYGFSPFKEDESNFYNGKISFALIKDNLYLIFDQSDLGLNLNFVQYSNSSKIGNSPPDAANLLIENFDIAMKEHREIVQKYLDYN